MFDSGSLCEPNELGNDGCTRDSHFRASSAQRSRTRGLTMGPPFVGATTAFAFAYNGCVPDGCRNPTRFDSVLPLI